MRDSGRYQLVERLLCLGPVKHHPVRHVHQLENCHRLLISLGVLKRVDQLTHAELDEVKLIAALGREARVPRSRKSHVHASEAAPIKLVRLPLGKVSQREDGAFDQL